MSTRTLWNLLLQYFLPDQIFILYDPSLFKLSQDFFQDYKIFFFLRKGSDHLRKFHLSLIQLISLLLDNIYQTSIFSYLIDPVEQSCW